jgi:hypothetical protein
MAIIRQIPWTEQPQGSVGVDWSNPLLAGAEFVRLGSQIFWNPTNVALTRVGGSSDTITLLGRAQIISDTQYESYPYPVANGGTGPWTLAGLFVPLDGLNSQFAAYVGMAEAPGSTTYDRCIRSESGFFWTAYLFDGAVKNAKTTVQPAQGRVDCVIATTDASSILVCSANGIEASTAVSSGGFAGYTSAEICIGKANNSSTSLAGIPLLVRTGRYWTPAQRKSFTENPWQLFAPRVQRIWAPVATSGAYSITAQPGSYAVSGQSSTITRSRLITASAGAYTYTGQTATISYTPAGAYTLTAQAGAYAVTGQSATLERSRVLNASAGSYLITGRSATITYSGAPAPGGLSGVYFDVLSGRLLVLRSGT